MKLEMVDTPTEEKIEMDQEEGFTPGPWTFSRGLHCYHVASADGTFETACIMFAGGKGSSAGNARLIAAAPALYEALIAIDKAMDNGDLVWNRKRYADSDPYDPAAVKLCAALALVDGPQEKK